MEFLPIILAIVVVLIVAGTIVALMLNREAERKQQMMSVIAGAGQVSASENETDDADVQNKRRAELAKKLKDEKEEEKGKRKTTLSMMLEQAGLSWSVMQYWIFSVFCMGVFIVMAYLFGQEAMIIGMAGFIGLLGFPRFVLKKLAAKRQKEFLMEFPDALEATVRLLKAGMPVSEAIAMIAKEFDGPVGDEMSRIYDQQKIGVPIHEAAQEAMRRIPLAEMQMFATGLSIQAQTGSSLSEVLMNLSGVIRARFKLKRKVKALSSEAVASAGIIASLPVIVTTGMYFLNYEYLEVMFTTKTGNMLMYGAVAWMGVGVFIMKQMINFRV
ncbi:MAG: type II secretion system F family protein [Bdellovibrionales bacterium]